MTPIFSTEIRNFPTFGYTGFTFELADKTIKICIADRTAMQGAWIDWWGQQDFMA